MSKKLPHKIELYQKTYKVDDRGQREIQWQELGCVLAHLTPYAKGILSGTAYEVIVADDPRIFSTDKVVWQGKDHFMMHSPHSIAPGYLKLRLFSWESKL